MKKDATAQNAIILIIRFIGISISRLNLVASYKKQKNFASVFRLFFEVISAATRRVI